MILWNGKDLIVFGLISVLAIFIAGAWLIEKIMFWLESKRIITDKWRTKAP